MSARRRVTQVLLGLALGLFATDCSPTPEGAGAAPAAATASLSADGLRLLSASPERVLGQLTRDGVTLQFVASDRGAQAELTLRDGAGQVLLQARRGAESSLSLLSDKLALRPAGQPGLRPEEVDQAGDPTAAAELNSRPEMRLLPTLSKLLGERGINGRDYPATYPLHLLASRLADSQEAQLLSEEARAIAPEVLACKDLRSDPYKNECFGMCGRGCSCWTWVCGDCCSHKGCAYHDTQCRTCSASNPNACRLCYVDFVKAFAMGGGCAS